MTGAEIQDFMTRRKLTHRQLADALGVTLGAVRHWVNGRRGVPETVVRLIRMFDADMAYLEYFQSLGSE